MPQVPEDSQDVQFSDVSNDKTRNKPKKDGPVNPTGTKTYKSTRSTVSIAGDSMIKHINGYKMSKANTKVRVSSFPGCTTQDMADYIQPIIRKKPNKLVLHVGTNNQRNRENSTTCAKDIIQLGESINRSIPEAKITISGLITRADEEILASKVNEVNAILKQSCLEKNWVFIEHCNITSQHLNKSKLHLNKQGTSLLACNFIIHIYARNH